MPMRPPVHRPGKSCGNVYVAPCHQRQTSARRGYGSRWQKARLGYLAKHPLCVECAQMGKVTAASVVDHIIPHEGDQTRFWDSENNWQSLCKPHHDAKTARDDGGFGNQRKRRGGAG